MTKTLISARPEFEKLFHIDMVGHGLPKNYHTVLRTGVGGIYDGQLLEDGKLVPTHWGWEVDYVNGRSEQGQPSGLGYSLFLKKGTFTIFDWLIDPPTLFISFFNYTTSVRESLKTPTGEIACFKRNVQHHEQRTFWYDLASTVLIKVEARAYDNTVLCECVLTEFTGPQAGSV